MTTGGNVQTIQRPGASQYNNYLGQVTTNNNALQGQWPAINNQVQSMLPMTNVLSPQFQQQLGTSLQNTFNQGLGNLTQGYGQMQNNSNNQNVSRFGGNNNSIARDVNGQNLGYFNQALGNLNNQMFNAQQTLQNNQLQQQQQGLNNYNNYQNYIDQYGRNSFMPTLSQAGNYAPYQVQGPSTNWGSLVGDAATIGAAPFTGGASLNYLPLAQSAGQLIGGMINAQ